MSSKSVPDRLPSFLFRRWVHRTASSATRALAVLWLASLSSAAPQPQPSAVDQQVQLMAQAGHAFAVSAIAFSPDLRFVLTAGKEHAAILWSVDEGKEIRKFEGLDDSAIACVAFLPDGHSVVTGGSDKTVRIWDLHTGHELQRLTDSMSIGSISISPKGDLIATTAAWDYWGYYGHSAPNAAHLWDRQSGKIIRSFDGPTDIVRAVAFSPDGKWLATASDDHIAKLWDIATGTEVHRLTGHESTVNAVAFSPDGTLLATGSGASDFELQMTSIIDPNQDALKAEHTVRLWNVGSGTEIKRIDAPATILALAFSSDGRY